MKSGCKKFSDSISPLTMPKSNKEIRELLDCLKIDIELYISSLEKGADTFVNHFKNSILPILEKKKLLEPFENQLTEYIRILEAKTVAIFRNFQVSINSLWNDIKQINRMSRYGEINHTKSMHFFVESLKIVYVEFSNLLMITSQTFFVLEFYCKILCALGCVKFALKVARAKLIQHNECWKQLKRFSDRNHSYCETCVVSDTCTSTIDFEALSRIYCYSMKIRQIVDYTPKLISFDIFKSGLMEPPFIYFKHLESILKENSLFYKCLSENMPKIRARYMFGKSIAKELTSPFLWGDEKRLKDAIRKNKDSDFYSYLLGRLYYQRNRFEEAVKPLEKAKKINPKNAEIWELLGIIYDAEAETKEDFEKVIKYIRKAKDLEPTNTDILWKTGIMELSMGNYSSSIENLTKAVKYARTDFEKCFIFSILSEAYRMKEMISKSKYYLKKSKKLSEPFTNETLEIIRKYIKERARLFGIKIKPP